MYVAFPRIPFCKPYSVLATLATDSASRTKMFSRKKRGYEDNHTQPTWFFGQELSFELVAAEGSGPRGPSLKHITFTFHPGCRAPRSATNSPFLPKASPRSDSATFAWSLAQLKLVLAKPGATAVADSASRAWYPKTTQIQLLNPVGWL